MAQQSPGKKQVLYNRLKQCTTIAATQNLNNCTEDELTEKILDCIELLPAKYKEAISLYYFQNKGIREMMVVIGMSESTVRSRLSYGLYLLKKCL